MTELMRASSSLAVVFRLKVTNIELSGLNESTASK